MPRRRHLGGERRPYLALPLLNSNPTPNPEPEPGPTPSPIPTPHQVTFDPDNNWIITGSFDRRVRIWANDGTRVTEITSFSDTLTGLCYVPATKTLWMSANSPHPIVYDPRSATDITAFLQQTANTAAENREAKERHAQAMHKPCTSHAHPMHIPCTSHARTRWHRIC